MINDPAFLTLYLQHLDAQAALRGELKRRWEAASQHFQTIDAAGSSLEQARRHLMLAQFNYFVRSYNERCTQSSEIETIYRTYRPQYGEYTEDDFRMLLIALFFLLEDMMFSPKVYSRENHGEPMILLVDEPKFHQKPTRPTRYMYCKPHQNPISLVEIQAFFEIVRAENAIGLYISPSHPPEDVRVFINQTTILHHLNIDHIFQVLTIGATIAAKESAALSQENDDLQSQAKALIAGWIARKRP